MRHQHVGDGYDDPYGGGGAGVHDRFSLSLIQRILLTTDGTVGCILEQHAGEPMDADRLGQSLGPAGADAPELEADPHEPFLRRSILLRGRRSRSTFLYADSFLRTKLLAPKILEALLTTDAPMGRLFREHRYETFREILRTGREPAGSCAPHFGIAEDDAMAMRTYRVIMAGQPCVLITEKFPVHGILHNDDLVLDVTTGGAS